MPDSCLLHNAQYTTSLTLSGIPCLFRYQDLDSWFRAEVLRLAQVLRVEMLEETVDEIVEGERTSRPLSAKSSVSWGAMYSAQGRALGQW